ncbi:unnamed protein product [Linum trigynum]|uniref:Uncharacterized protein n=1 Tax=Linum trigynum TaxID=586398 RepID=A0AAV2EUP5_9ROSI
MAFFVATRAVGDRGASFISVSDNEQNNQRSVDQLAPPLRAATCIGDFFEIKEFTNSCQEISTQSLKVNHVESDGGGGCSGAVVCRGCCCLAMGGSSVAGVWVAKSSSPPGCSTCHSLSSVASSSSTATGRSTVVISAAYVGGE